MAAVDAAIALVSLDDAKVYLNIVNDTSDDSLLGFMINEASAKCNAYVGHKLISATYTEYYDGNGESTVILKNFPIISVTSLHDDLARSFADASLIAAADYIIHNADGMLELWKGSIFSKGRANVKVVYVAGYATGSVPYDLQDAVKRWIADAYFKWKNKRHGIQSITLTDRTTTYTVGDVPPDVKAILNRHRDSTRDLI